MQAFLVPCWWVGWWLWRAGCISQDTYLLYGTTLSLHSTSQDHLCGESVVGERAYDGWVARGTQAWRKRRRTRSVGWGWKSGGWYLSLVLSSPLLQSRPGKLWLMVVCFCYHIVWEQCTDDICQSLDNFYGLDSFINQNIMEQKNVFHCSDHYRSLHFNFVKPQKGQNHENTKKNTKDMGNYFVSYGHVCTMFLSVEPKL